MEVIDKSMAEQLTYRQRTHTRTHTHTHTHTHARTHTLHTCASDSSVLRVATVVLVVARIRTISHIQLKSIALNVVQYNRTCPLKILTNIKNLDRSKFGDPLNIVTWAQKYRQPTPKILHSTHQNCNCPHKILKQLSKCFAIQIFYAKPIKYLRQTTQKNRPTSPKWANCRG